LTAQEEQRPIVGVGHAAHELVEGLLDPAAKLRSLAARLPSQAIRLAAGNLTPATAPPVQIDMGLGTNPLGFGSLGGRVACTGSRALT